MTTPDIWSKLVLTLQQSPLLSYITYVYEGARIIDDEKSLPCLMLEPINDGEIERNMNQVMDMYFNVNIYGFSSANYNEFPKAIVGDDLYKGILDIQKDLAAVLQRSYSLGDTVIDVKVQTTEYDRVDMGKYPVRGFVTPIKILYRKINEA